MIPQKGAKQHNPDTATMHARVRHQNASASATRMTNGARRRRASRQRARCQGASWWREVWWNGLRSPARGRGEGQGGSDARRGGAERAWPTTERPSTAWPPNVRPTPATRQRGVVERLPPRSVPFVTAAPERPALNTTGLLTAVALSAGLRTPDPDVCPAQVGVSQHFRLRQGREHHQLPLPPAIIF